MLSNLVKLRIIHLRKFQLLNNCVPCCNLTFLSATIKKPIDSNFIEFGTISQRNIHLGKFLLTGNENTTNQNNQTNKSNQINSIPNNDSATNKNKAREPSLISKLLRIKDFVDLIIFGFLVTGVYFAYQKVKEKQNKEKEYEVEWVNLPNYKHKLFTCSGFYLPEFLFKNLSDFKSFEPKKDDVWVISFPKSGTTWVQEIVYLIMNNCNFEKAKSKSIEERSPFFDFPSPGLKFIKNMESPRVIKSHLPISFLPEDLENKSKIIYITRNPKDTSVSYYHFTKLSTQAEYKGTFQDFLELFTNGKVPYGPWWKHVDEFANRKNVLLIHYEDLHEKPHEIVKETCKFLGKDLSDKEIDSIVTWCLFDNMKQNTMVNYDWYKEIGLFRKEGSFFRKGKIGDWLNHYSRSASIEFDETINKNLNYKKKFNYGITEEDLKAIYTVKID